ncbi:hypothetical protein [Paenibacillus sp. YSY-4.3]
MEVTRHGQTWEKKLEKVARSRWAGIGQRIAGQEKGRNEGWN